jgi:hypothetical protein
MTARPMLLAAVMLAGAACSERKAEHSGVGRWTFTSSTLAQGKQAGRCQPTELSDGRKAMWCFGVPPFKIGGRVTEINLYFGGTADDAKLIEIQLQTRGCVEADLETWMRSNFGAPFETRAGRAYWKNSFLWAAALMPSEPGRCIVHLLPLSEGSEIERIKQK